MMCFLKMYIQTKEEALPPQQGFHLLGGQTTLPLIPLLYAKCSLVSRTPTGKLTISNIKNSEDRFKDSSPCCKKAAVSSASLKQPTKAPPVLQPLGVSLEKIYIFVSFFQHSMSGYKGMTPEGLPFDEGTAEDLAEVDAWANWYEGAAKEYEDTPWAMEFAARERAIEDAGRGR